MDVKDANVANFEPLKDYGKYVKFAVNPCNSPNARACTFCRILTTNMQYFPKHRSLTETSVKYKLALRL